MGRPSKLTPDQWREIEHRAAAGEGIRSLAREFRVSPTTIGSRVSGQTGHVQKVAEQLANAQTALAALPTSQQYLAVSLAEKLRKISDNLASAAHYGAATAHRLTALANSEVSKVDDAAPLSGESMDAMRGVSALTKLANDSAAIALNLLAANKETVKALNLDPPKETSIDPGKLSSGTLHELLKLRG